MRESAIETAMWAADLDTLHELAPCICCCASHTFGNCPARQWEGCRGGNGPTPDEIDEAWARHYQRFHGMSREQFFGGDSIAPEN